MSLHCIRISGENQRHSSLETLLQRELFYINNVVIIVSYLLFCQFKFMCCDRETIHLFNVSHY